MTFVHVIFVACTFASVLVHGLSAQARSIPVSREAAVAAALRSSPRIAITRADSLASYASLLAARQFDNPLVASSYSESTPKAHFSLEFPIDWPAARSPRIAAAQANLEATTIRSLYSRVLLVLDVDTTYTRAQALEARATISAKSARDADSLRVIAQFRRDAGDASELNVEVASIFAAQTSNNATSDSLALASLTLVLQTLTGFSPDSAPIVLSETLDTAAVAINRNSAPPAISSASLVALLSGPRGFAGLSLSSSLPVAAYELDVTSATSGVLAQRRRRFLAPTFAVGFETIDAGNNHAILPTVGFTLPLPLLNRNSAAIIGANAQLERARASLNLAKLENEILARTARQNLSAANTRVARSRALVASANRVSSLSLLAYREGAATLSSALDAQRSARDALAQFVDDVANARIAASVLQLYEQLDSRLAPPSRQ